VATETTIKVTADTSQAQGAVKDLDRALGGLQNTGATVSKALLGVTAAAAGVGFAIKSVLDSAGELFDAADALGMSVQNLQVFQKAAGEVGVSAEALNMSLQKMNANIGDALIKGTGPAVDAFKRLGISLDTINGLKPDQQFELIAKQLNAIPNQAEKAALAMDLFGKQGIKILKIAENLDEMKKKMEALGMLITPEQQASLDLAGDAVDSLTGMFSTGLKKAVAELGPYILAFVYTIEDAVKAAGGLDNIIAKLGAVVRYAFNVAIIMAFVGGIRLIYTGIVNAQAAFILFNTIVKRSPLFLLVAAAAALAQYFGVDVAGAVGKVFDITDNLGKANEKIAESAKEIKEKNEEAATAVKRGNVEGDKALKNLESTIKKLEAEAQYQQDKVRLGETEALVQKTIREEAEKLALVNVSLSAGQRERLANAVRQVEEGKALVALDNTMYDLETEMLKLTTLDANEQERSLGIRKLAKDMNRALTSEEQVKYETQLKQVQAQRLITEEYNKQFDRVKGLADSTEGTLLKSVKDLQAAQAVMKQSVFGGAGGMTDEQKKNFTMSSRAQLVAEETLALEVAKMTDLREAGRLEIVQKYGRMQMDVFRAFAKDRETLEAAGYNEQKIIMALDAQETKDLEAYKLTLLANTHQERMNMMSLELKALEAQYTTTEMLEFQHQENIKAIKAKAAQDTMAMQLANGTAENQFRKFSGDEAKQIAADRAAFEKKTELEKTSFAIDQGAQVFNALGTYNKEAFQAAKAFNIANAIMNTYMGATKALATYPPPFNFIAAAGVVAMGLAQVASIRSQQYSGRALGGPVMGGQSYIVGESGPELFTPQGTGSITRNGDIGGGGTTNVTFNIVANDTAGFDQLLTSRRGLITTIIADAQLERGRRA
jgi:hypothetical protein